jgi:hypothetical protein
MKCVCGVVSGNLRFLRTSHRLGTSGYHCSRTRLCKCIGEPYPGSEDCEKLRDQPIRLHFLSRTSHALLIYSMLEVSLVGHQRFRLSLLSAPSLLGVMDALTLPKVTP